MRLALLDLTADCQFVADEVDAHVVALDAGNLGLDHVGAGFLLDGEGRQLDHTATGTQARVEPPNETPRRRGLASRILAENLLETMTESDIGLVTVDVSREERIAKNEAVFRDVNDNIRAAIGQQGNDGHVFAFLCECADPRCMEWVELTVAEYEEIRAGGTGYVLGPGHPSQAEAGSGAGGRELPAAQQGDASAVAETHDPRAA